jgi:hypothetical protein
MVFQSRGPTKLLSIQQKSLYSKREIQRNHMLNRGLSAHSLDFSDNYEQEKII